MGAMSASFVAGLFTAVAGVLAAACFTPKRHTGRGDRWISFAIGALAGTALLEILPRAWRDLGSAQSALSLTLLGAVCCFAADRAFITFKRARFMLFGLICVGGTHFLLEPVI